MTRFRIVPNSALAVLAFTLAMAALPAVGNHYILCSETAKCDLPPWPPTEAPLDDAPAKSRFFAIRSAVQPDGKVLKGGGIQHDATASFPHAGYFFAVERSNADGSPDLDFNGTGLAQIPIWGYYEFVYSLVVQPDGKIVVGGSASDPIGIDMGHDCYPADCKYYPTLTRLNPDGTLDRSFNGNGRLILEIGDANRGPEVGQLGSLLGLELQPDGKIIVRSNGPGDVGRIDADGRLTYDHLTDVARVNADGTLDTSFVGTKKVAREIPYFAPPAKLNFQGLWWNASPKQESGWGINFVHQGDTIFASWLTYDATGNSWWLSITANKTAAKLPTFTGDVVETRGPPFSAPPTHSNAVARAVVGTATIAFAGLDWGTFAYSVNGTTQTKAISRMVFGPVPTCEYFTEAAFATAANYQNLWWAPGGGEGGWGLNLTHQGDKIFANWLTYDSEGKPLWLSTTASSEGAGVYSGTLVRTAGPAFGAASFDPALVTRTEVGTATLTFSSASSGNFAYTVNGFAGSKVIVPAAFSPPAGTLCRQA